MGNSIKMAGHTAGDPIECYGIPIVLHKEPELTQNGDYIYETDGKQKYRCGFKIGGGIDQDPFKSPQGYPDKGVYITFVAENSPASHAGLQMHDKILQVNGNDFTVVTHKKAVDYVRRKPVLNMLVYRKGVPHLQKPMAPQFQMQQQNMPPQNMQQQPNMQPQQQQQPIYNNQQAPPHPQYNPYGQQGHNPQAFRQY